jgi:hypothetical protein
MPADADAASIMQIKVWLVGISPMVWRRLHAALLTPERESSGLFQVAL